MGKNFLCGLQIPPYNSILGPKKDWVKAKKSHLFVLKNVEMEYMRKYMSLIMVDYLSIHIPVTFPLDFLCGLHIPPHTSILGQKEASKEQNEPFSPLNKRGKGRNVMKYTSFIMLDHIEL